ncbi:TPA: hypothetical protein ACLGW6_000344 [Salmonella enterica]
MARSDYDIINLSPEHELNEWLAERGYAGQADNRNRVAEIVTRKLQDSFYVSVSRDALNTAYKDICFPFPLRKTQLQSHF